MKKHSFLLFVCFSALFLFHLPLAFATDYTFTGAGSWSQPARWSGGAVPPNPLSVFDKIIIDGTCTLDDAEKTIYGVLEVNALRKLTISHDLTIQNLGLLYNDGEIDMSGNPSIQLYFSALVNTGIIESNVYAYDAEIDNQNTIGGIITLETNATLDNSGFLSGILTVQDNASVINELGGIMSFFFGGALRLDNGDLTNYGTISITSTSDVSKALNASNLTNNGTLSSQALFQNSGNSVLDNYGDMTIGGTFYNQAGLMNHSGSLTIDGSVINSSNFQSDAQITNNGTLTNETGGFFANKSLFYNYDVITNSGLFINVGPSGNFQNNSGSLTNFGTFTNGPNCNVTNLALIDNKPGGIFNNEQLFSNICPNGLMKNNGTFNQNSFFNNLCQYQGTGVWNGQLLNEGNIAPGNSIGKTTVNGNLNSSAGTMTFEIGSAGGTAGVDFDQIAVGAGGTVENASAISVDFQFTPTAGQTFPLIQHTAGGSFSGPEPTLTVTPNTISATIAAGVLTVNSVLPIELLRFSLKKEGEQVRLFWSSAIETNFNGYEIQRSRDGIAFEKIAFEKGQNTAGVATEYSFLDENPWMGRSFYRLAMLDMNGQRAYSDIVRFQKGGLDNAVLVLAPNPGQGVFQFVPDMDRETEILAGGPIVLDVFAADGRLVLRLPASDFLPVIDLRNEPNGLYQVVLTSATGISQAIWVSLQ